MGVFRNKTVRNQLFLSLFFLFLQGRQHLLLTEAQGFLYSFQEQDGAYCRFFCRKTI